MSVLPIWAQTGLLLSDVGCARPWYQQDSHPAPFSFLGMRAFAFFGIRNINVVMGDLTIENAVCSIKEMIEQAIRDGGVEGKNNLIRSQQPICMLHDAAKSAFIRNGVNPTRVRPLLGEHMDELKLAGFFKCKDQDICFLPNHVRGQKEFLQFDGILKGQLDEFGTELTEHILSVNVRSQLSSIAKNFDTLYERTFAEALNLHLRCEKMVLGEFYMIPVKEYDDTEAKYNRIAFKKNKNVQKHIEKYLYSFSAVNNRRCLCGEEYKYERVCLLIVDFNKSTPVIYNTDDDLKAAGLLPEDSQASINEMNFPTFAPTLMRLYEERFGLDRFI